MFFFGVACLGLLCLLCLGSSNCSSNFGCCFAFAHNAMAFCNARTSGTTESLTHLGTTVPRPTTLAFLDPGWASFSGVANRPFRCSNSEAPSNMVPRMAQSPKITVFSGAVLWVSIFGCPLWAEAGTFLEAHGHTCIGKAYPSALCAGLASIYNQWRQQIMQAVNQPAAPPEFGDLHLHARKGKKTLLLIYELFFTPKFSPKKRVSFQGRAARLVPKEISQRPGFLKAISSMESRLRC